MTTIRTALNLRKFEARRLMKRGYEILHIETQHRDDGDETAIVWTRPPRPDDIPEHRPHQRCRNSANRLPHLAAFERLGCWLRDPRTGKPVSDAAEETLRVLRRALVDGKNGYWHAAEESLAALLAAPPSGVKPLDDRQFCQDV